MSCHVSYITGADENVGQIKLKCDADAEGLFLCVCVCVGLCVCVWRFNGMKNGWKSRIGIVLRA